MKNLLPVFLLVSGLTFAQTITLKGSLTNGNSGTDIWEYVDPNTGNIYAIVGGNGMSVVDVTDPTTPVQVAHLTNAPGFDVKVWSHYVYCTHNGGGGEIFDLSDPTSPQIAGTFSGGHNLFIDDRGYMYISVSGVVAIYDLNPDPTNPIFLAQVTNGHHDVTVRGNIMYSFEGGSGTRIYDVTNPASPILISAITDPSINYSHSGDISANGNFLYICDELSNHPEPDIIVYDISDIANPVRVSDYADPDATAHNLYVIGDYAYSSYYTAGFKVFDITDPSQLVLADEYDTNNISGQGFAGAFGVYPSPVTANIYINDGSGVYIFGFSELGVFAKDVGVNNIITPVSGILTNAEIVEVSIRNYGLDPQSNIPLELRVDGILIATETFTGTINSGDTVTYQFTQTVDLSIFGQTYSIEVKTVLAGDEFQNNDGYTKDVIHLLSDDVGTLAITSPVSGYGLGIETISITVKNFGFSSQSNFEVQYILDGASPVVETFTGTINSGEELNYNFNQTADFSAIGTYDLSARTSLTGDGDTSNDEISVVIENIICQPSLDCSSGDGFQLFQVAEINNPSGCEGYGDFTNLSANLSQGTIYDLTITTGYGDQYISVWIDYNDDFVYTANELVVDNYVIAPGQTAGTYTETMDLVVPANATLGQHIMRAKSNRNAPVPSDGCVVTQYGETEDYMANIGVLGIDDLSIAQSDLVVTILPNNQFNVSLITNYNGKAFVSVFNMLGQQFFSKDIFKTDNRYNLNLDMSSVSSGIYIIKMGSLESNIYKTARIIVK